MARAIWSGAISFGLVNIPVQVMSAQETKRLSFHMLDSQDNSPISYKKVSKSTGKDVPPKRIVKGYEYKPGQYVIIQDQDFKKANPKATQTIDIEDFVELKDVDILMFEKPYYLVPAKTGNKGYVLLRSVLEETGKVAIARFVMQDKAHLVAIIARDKYLILETLRFAHEVREVEQAEYLDAAAIGKIKISPKELKMAQELVSGMTTSWKPEKYKDTYQDDLLKFIKQKIKKGDVEEAAEVEDEDSSAKSNRNVVDLMPLLEKSLLAAGAAGKRAKAKKSKKSAPAKEA